LTKQDIASRVFYVLLIMQNIHIWSDVAVPGQYDRHIKPPAKPDLQTVFNCTSTV